VNSKGGKEQKMKKLLKSKKALSPVVAAIILIAVTVAVSIAVAAWMGSLTFTFMETEEVSFTQVEFITVATLNNRINVTIQNTGTADIVITQAKVTGYDVDQTVVLSSAESIAAGYSAEIQLDILDSEVWSAGKAYNIELLTTKGNKFPVMETA